MKPLIVSFTSSYHRQSKRERYHHHAANQGRSTTTVVIVVFGDSATIPTNVSGHSHPHTEVSLAISDGSPARRLCAPVQEVDTLVQAGSQIRAHRSPAGIARVESGTYHDRAPVQMVHYSGGRQSYGRHYVKLRFIRQFVIEVDYYRRGRLGDG